MDPESYPFPPSSRSPPSLDNRPSLSFAPRPRLLPLPSVSPLPSPSSPRPPSVDVASRRLVYTTRRTTMDYPMTSFASLSSQNSPINLDGRSDLPLGPEHEAIILTGRAENPNTPVPGSDTASTTSASSIPMEPTTTTPAPQRRRLVRRTAAERTHVVDLTGQDEPPPGPPLHRLPLPRQIGPQSPRMTVPPSVAFRHLYERSPLFSEPTMVDDSTTSLGRSVAAREAGQVAGNGQTTQLLSFVSALERDLQALRHSMAQQQPSDPNLLNSIVTTAGHLRLSALDQRHARTVDSATAPRRSVLTRTGVPHPVPWNNVRTAQPDARRGSSAHSSISTLSFPSVTNLPTPPFTGPSGLLFTEPASYEPGSGSVPDSRGSSMNVDPPPNYRITRQLDQDGQEVVRTIPRSNLQWIDDDSVRWVSEPSVMTVDGPAPPRVRRLRGNPTRDSQNSGPRSGSSSMEDGIPMELAGLDANGNEVQLPEEERRRRLRSLFYDSSLMTTTSTSIIPDEVQHIEPTLRVRISGSGPNAAAASTSRPSPPGGGATAAIIPAESVPQVIPTAYSPPEPKYSPCPLPIPVDEMIPRPTNKRKRSTPIFAAASADFAGR